MNWKNTWLLVGVAAALFGFIYLYERHLQTSDAVDAPQSLLGAFKAVSADSLQLRRGNAFVVTLGRTNNEWRYISPFSYPAATVAVDGLLETLDQVIPDSHITPQEMVARKQTSADFGFDAPTIVITLQHGSEVQNLRFGARTPGNDQVYVDVGRPGIYVVSATILDRLPRNQNAWRAPALITIPESKVERVEIAAGAAGGFELRRDPTNKVWRLTRPSHRADQLKAAYLVKQLADAQVASFVLDEPRVDLEPFGLQAPVAEVTVAGGAEVQKIQFGRSPTNDTSQVYARQVGASNVVLVSRGVLDLVSTNAYTEYRDRRLIAFAPENVQAVEIRSADPFTITRQANGQWTVSDSPVDSEFVNWWLSEFSRIDIRDFAKDVVEDLTPLGLANPRLSVLLRLQTPGGGLQTNRIDFGTNDTAETVLVRRADEGSVYSISGRALLETPSAPWQVGEHRVWSFTTNQVVRVMARERGRTRQFLRQAGGQWASTTGEVNPFAMEETMYVLGNLRAVAWVDRGEQALQRHGFGTENYEVSVDLKDGEKTQTLTLRFSISPLGLPLAVTTMEGQPWVFVFPWPIFADLQRYLSVSSAGAGL